MKNHHHILLEDLHKKFDVFGEGLMSLQHDIKTIYSELKKTNEKADENRFLMLRLQDDVQDLKTTVNQLNLAQIETNMRLGSIEKRLDTIELTVYQKSPTY